MEFAPFQKIAKKRSKKKDAKAGTIDEGNSLEMLDSDPHCILAKYGIQKYMCFPSPSTDADYKKFLENYNRDDEKFTSTPETLLEEIEAKTKELGGVCLHME